MEKMSTMTFKVRLGNHVTNKNGNKPILMKKAYEKVIKIFVLYYVYVLMYLFLASPWKLILI